MTDVKRWTYWARQGVFEDGLILSVNTDFVRASDYDALKAERDRYQAALVAVSHIAPLGVDTYPEVYRLIQQAVSNVLTGAAHPTDAQPNTPKGAQP